jgi:predicted nucleotidyltransferase
MDKNIFKKLGKQFRLDFIVLFGSAAKNFDSGRSDVDIAAKAKPGFELSDEQMLSLYDKISKIFCGKELDLVPIDPDTSPLLMKEISDNGIILYERETGVFSEWGWIAAKYYDDFRFVSRHFFEDMRDAKPA